MKPGRFLRRIIVSDWIKWEGGECPVAEGTLVDAKHRDGEVFYGQSAGKKFGFVENWAHIGHHGDIVAYRLCGVDGEEKPESALDIQIGGDHYKAEKEYQPWVVYKRWMTPEEFKGYMKGEAMTYLQRERLKGGRQDIEKACHVLQAYLEMAADENKTT